MNNDPMTYPMIVDDFVCFDANGLYCKYGDFYIDPVQPVTNAVIGNNKVCATAATLAFMQLRYGKNAGRLLNAISYNQPFLIRDIQITFIPAGHMLGSAQILMEYKGIKYLYTGDYKLQPDATCEPIEWVKADVLITESTFANPEILHPDPVLSLIHISEPTRQAEISYAV